MSTLPPGPIPPGASTDASVPRSPLGVTLPAGLPAGWHRPVVDLAQRRIIAWELGLAPSGMDPSIHHNDLRLRLLMRLQWMAEAIEAGLLADGQVVILPAHTGIAVAASGMLAQILEGAASNIGLAPLPAHRIVIQFQSGHADEAPEQRHALIRLLRQHGLGIALHGFGSGFDSMRDLIEAKPDLLCLSPALTHALEGDHTRRSIVTAMVELARELGVRMMADGVSSAAEAALLQDLGICLQAGPLHGDAQPLATAGR